MRHIEQSSGEACGEWEDLVGRFAGGETKAFQPDVLEVGNERLAQGLGTDFLQAVDVCVQAADLVEQAVAAAGPFRDAHRGVIVFRPCPQQRGEKGGIVTNRCAQMNTHLPRGGGRGSCT